MNNKIMPIVVGCLISVILLGAGKRPSDQVIKEAVQAQPTKIATPTMMATAITYQLDQAEKDLAQAQDNINFFHAKFQLTVVDPITNKNHLKASGQVWLANNRRYRVLYEKPEKQLLISNGQKRWLYLPKLNQVQVQAMPPEGSPTEFFLELGGGLTRVLQTCHAKYKSSKNAEIYTLTPRKADQAQFSQAIIWTTGKDKLPIKLEVFSKRVITVTFDHIQVKVGDQQMTDQEINQFKFKLPKDAEVIEMFWPMK